MQQVRAFEMREVSLRNAALIKTRLRANRGVADLSFELLFGDERRDRIEDNNVERIGTNQGLDNPERFLAGTRLRDEQIIHVHAEPAGVLRIERVLHIDEGGEAAALLRLRDDRQGERRFTGRFRPVNFHDASARKSADAERAVDQDVAGGDDFDVDDLFVAESHDRAFAVIFGDLLDGEFEVFVASGDKFIFGGFFFSFGGHSGFLGTSLHAPRQAEKRSAW